MSYLKKVLSTLASMNYYSGSNDLLDDHCSPTYLKFVSEHTFDNQTHHESLLTAADENDSEVFKHHRSELVGVELCGSEMNNSYSSR
ncbi:hypothetical protein OPW41_12690 [Vibrio europaeus]|uniref:hypothetical protein n=1 Tax=Vibrio europaeus TaxID=300876 RepID=UPI00233EEDBA|nr:hypothetical protein [Vibrio europaeus]MDC5721786.1 hypothetical protein [Vibrio europaeus]MDC5758176.1 hypothetical protein [Vibrio europaeus]MDC5776453.1 hypothetical protein [Vibrio europaeus]MDC5795688.1 hypothetical protein [Vibrio europaeus]MDC5801631.1 hypothetical protein [Vibrio europaeus]